MPIRRFRRIEDMESSPWREPGDPALYRAIRSVWGMTHRTLAPRFPTGTRRFRTMDEMNAARERVEEANFRDYRARTWREGGGPDSSGADVPRSRR